ncbi:hypothetical protein [Halomarina oriensis]|uniref:Uncharacterized protein n=1 Tax=Halomarina oriensis TaxID=671145 RepID=A0A6B0GEY1_9EURY|nr:hypothetical protein [Halomarina oriensis]MWG33110.1 hypothetical protein [Halomarina oriensis]
MFDIINTVGRSFVVLILAAISLGGALLAARIILGVNSGPFSPVGIDLLTTTTAIYGLLIGGTGLVAALALSALGWLDDGF